MQKPVSAASERNKQVILEVILPVFSNCQDILEIGTGTGQHAVFFGAQMPHLSWHTSDLLENHDAIRAWLQDSETENVLPPLELDVDQAHWPVRQFDGVFSANTAHIMACSSVRNMFGGIGRVLKSQAVFCLYGPFNYNQVFTSPSNADFDAWLKSVAPHQGVRNFEDVCDLANANGMNLESDIEMPANNKLLVFRKTMESGTG